MLTWTCSVCLGRMQGCRGILYVVGQFIFMEGAVEGVAAPTQDGRVNVNGYVTPNN